MEESHGNCGYYTTEQTENQVCRKCFSALADGPFCPKCGTDQRKTRKGRTRGNGTGTAYRVGKTWAAAVVVGYKLVTKDGVTRSVPIRRKKQGFKTKKEALAYLPILQGGTIERRTPTINDLWVAFQEGHYKKLSASKQEGYRIAFRKMGSIQSVRIDVLTTSLLQRVVNENATTYYPAKDMKDLLSKLFQLAMADQFVTVNLSKFLVLPDLDAKEREAFTDSEIRLLWDDYAAGNSWTGYLLLMIYTGMMPGELLDAKKESIDWERKEIVKAGKKTKKRKETPMVLADIIIPVLADLCATTPGEKLIAINKDNFYKRYYEALERAGTRRLSPYSCRHSTATALALANIAPSIIQQIMRHAKFTTTQQYIHIDMTSCLEAINRLAGKPDQA